MEPNGQHAAGVSQQTSATSSGDYSPAYAVGHDLYVIERQEVFTEPDFAPLDLDDFLPPTFPESDAIPVLLRLLRQNHLVLIGRAEPDDLEDKRTFARHLAACHQQSSGLPVREWISDQAPGAQRLDYHLRQTDEPTIFVLNDMHPVDVDHDLSALVTAARNNSHFVIATTHSSRHVWANIDPQHWCSVANGDAYSAEYLERLLRRELEDHASGFPDFLKAHLENDELVPGTRIRHAAMRIHHPLRIMTFAQELGQIPLPQDISEIHERLEALDGSRNALRKWFLRLDHDEQVLTLGLALFHGLFDDQMFAGVERLIESIWRRRDPRQKTYDYTDLIQVGAYFRLEGIRHGRPFRIEVSPDHLQELFQLAWDFHRRRLMSSLPALVEIARDAVRDRPRLDIGEDPEQDAPARETEESIEEAARATRWYRTQTGVELFGSPRRNRQLRASISAALAQIGELSIEAVKVVLRNLGTDGYRGSQEIVAQTVSRWRESTPTNLASQLFDLLRDWERARVRKELGVSDQDKSNLGTTVALALGYAGRFDPPNALHEELVDLLVKLATRNEEVSIRSALRDPVIPRLIAWHPRKLAATVEGHLALHSELRLAVAQGYAEAYAHRTTEVMELLDTWHEQVLSDSLEWATKCGVGVIVARAYGFIHPSRDSTGWTLEAILERLRAFLSQERNREIRHAAFAAAFSQFQGNLADGALPLRRLVDETSLLADRPYLMRLLARLYLDERLKAGPGEDVVSVEGKSYDLWITAESPRPLTGVELCLYQWLLDGSHPVTQQIATEAFAHLAYTPVDREEAKRQRQWLQAAGRGLEAQPVPSDRHRFRPLPIPHSLPNRHPLPRLAAWALLWATLGRDEARRQAHAPLAQWIHLKRLEGTTSDIENRWQRTSIEGLEEFRQTLLKAFKLYDLRTPLLLLLFVLGLAALLLLVT